ncbi:MAG: DUF3179 domain-containing protein [Phycisphaerales bacterium]|nr:DUF3179 domain-containing protein [Phycisphaerales bacterium]
MRTPTKMTLTLLAGVALAGGGAACTAKADAEQNVKPIAQTQDSTQAQPEEKAFEQVSRPGSVDVDTEYNLDGLLIPRGEIHTLLPRDAIPSLTDPDLVELSQADWLNDDDRIIDVTVGDESVAVPLKILNFHEVANMTIGGDPVAATYCPLCDSVTLVRRTVKITPTDPMEDAYEEVLEFGVSGALYNSNVLMYDRQHLGLWSQLGLKAVSGPMAGTQLELLPVKIIPWSQYQADHPDGKVISIETGHDRPYDGNPYQRYFENEDFIMVPIGDFGDALPKKTLGLGIKTNDQSFFVPASSIGERFVIATDAGKVIAVSTKAGVQVISAPAGVMTVQSFYYSFSAFHPETVVVTESAE